MKLIVISPALLERWRTHRSDMIVFDLQPEGSCEPPPARCGDSLPVTPSEVQHLIGWIPPESTVVFRNQGVSSRSVMRVQQMLASRDTLRIFWLDRTAEGLSARACNRDPVTQHRSL